MTIKGILKKAQAHLSKEGDDKCWANPSDLITLIRAGAVVVEDKYQNDDKHWVTKMNYGGFNFVLFSRSKLTS